MAAPSKLSRRGIIRTSAAAAALSWLGAGSRRASAAVERKRVLRMAHLADTHIQPQLAADKGVAAALNHLQSQAVKPDLILHTGDIIMDSFAAKEPRMRKLWDLWTSTMRSELSLPIHYALGNHDIWGWDKTKSETRGDEPSYGKKWVSDVLGLAKPYHSFDQGGWHFVALDSVRPFGNSAYAAYLDEEQFAWLESDLAQVSPATPICVYSHIPIVTVTSHINSPVDPASTQPADTADVPRGKAGQKLYRPDRGDFLVSGASQHGDFRRLKALFAKYPNVRVALSGHTHLIDRVDYNNVSYLCGGAVSANWWKGVHQGECDFGYTLLDLYDDGSFDRTYVPFGWTARM
ncbi:MAG: metallophosphoesterase [Tepidisphaeraceae bacterium]